MDVNIRWNVDYIHYHEIEGNQREQGDNPKAGYGRIADQGRGLRGYYTEETLQSKRRNNTIMNKLKYLLIGDSRGNKFQKEPESNELKLAGLYQWSNVFREFGNGGDIQPYWRKEDLEEYDIIHINYTPSNNQLPQWVKEELGNSSSSKIVINVDLDAKQWGQNFAYNILSMRKDLECADVLFHVEPHGAELLEHLIGRKVCVNPIR